MWLEYVRALWPVVLGLSTLLAGIAMLWLSAKFISRPVHDALAAKVDGKAEKKAHDHLATKLDGLILAAAEHETRLKHIEIQLESAPTRQELQDDIAVIAADMAGVKASIDGFRQQLATTNSYLHTLIEKGLPGAGSRR